MKLRWIFYLIGTGLGVLAKLLFNTGADEGACLIIMAIGLAIVIGSYALACYVDKEYL